MSSKPRLIEPRRTAPVLKRPDGQSYVHLDLTVREGSGFAVQVGTDTSASSGLVSDSVGIVAILAATTVIAP